MVTATNRGEFISQLVPEPDSILTVAWSRAIVDGLRRVFWGESKVGTLSSSTNPYIFTATSPGYAKMPFVKIWAHAGSGSGRYYSDYYSQGSSAAQISWINYTFVDKVSPFEADIATVNFSTYISGMEGFTILMHGR